MAVEPEEIDIDEYNQKVITWGSNLGKKIRSSIQLLTSKGKGDLLKSLSLRSAKMDGEVDKLSYHFLRHGVFEHKGVGRGYVMQGGTVVRGYTAKEMQILGRNKNRRVPSKVLKSGSINRKPVEWFNPVVAENIEQLADLVTEMKAGNVVNTTKILIQ